MAPEEGRHEGEPKPPEPITDGARARAELATDTAAGLVAAPDPYAQARKRAETLGVPFMSHKEAKATGHLNANGTGPAEGYIWEDDPSRQEKSVRNWAVKKIGDSAREQAAIKGLPFMTHQEAVRKKLVARNAKGNWEPAQGYEWVDQPNKSNNWAVRKKTSGPLPPPAIEPQAPKKPKKVPKSVPKPAPAKSAPRPAPKPALAPKPAPAPKSTPEFKREEAYAMEQLPNQPDWFPKHIHITIDDGPRIHNGRFQKILEALNKYKVKATFFLVGGVIAMNYRKNPKKTRELLRQLIASGHQIGYHSYEHITGTSKGKKSLDKQDAATIKTDIGKFQKILDEALGYHYSLKVGRMPGGSGTFDIHVVRAFAEMGLQPPKYWHVKTETWEARVRNNNQQYVSNAVKLKGDHIILLHELAKTAEDLDKFLSELKKQTTASLSPSSPSEKFEWPNYDPQLLGTVKLALTAERLIIPQDDEIDSIAQMMYSSAGQNYTNPQDAISDPSFTDSIVNEIRFRGFAAKPMPEPDPEPKVATEAAPEKIDFDIDDLPELNNNGHVSIIIAGGRVRGEEGATGGAGLFDGIKQVIYDPATNKLVVVDISRDTIEHGRKLNARTKNSMEKLKREIQDMTGESTTYTVRLTLKTMEELGDTMIRILGPIEVHMQHNYVGMVGGRAVFFPKHSILDSGAKLLHFVQFRKGFIVRDNYPHAESTTDIARSAVTRPYIIQSVGGNEPRVLRQTLALQALITAFTAKLEGKKGLIASGVESLFGKRAAFAVDNLGGIKDIHDVVADNTNVGLTDIPAFLAMAKLFKLGGAKIEKIPASLEGTPYYRKKVAQAIPPNKFAKVKTTLKNETRKTPT